MRIDELVRTYVHLNSADSPRWSVKFHTFLFIGAVIAAGIGTAAWVAGPGSRTAPAAAHDEGGAPPADEADAAPLDALRETPLPDGAGDAAGGALDGGPDLPDLPDDPVGNVTGSGAGGLGHGGLHAP